MDNVDGHMIKPDCTEYDYAIILSVTPTKIIIEEQK